MIFTVAEIDLILLAQKEKGLHVNTWRTIVIEETQTAKKPHRKHNQNNNKTQNIIKLGLSKVNKFW